MVPELSVALLKEWVLNQMHVMKELRYNYNTTVMELFSRRRWRLDLPKQKAVVFVLNPEKLSNTFMA